MKSRSRLICALEFCLHSTFAIQLSMISCNRWSFSGIFHDTAVNLPLHPTVREQLLYSALYKCMSFLKK
ncbi:hypothetical protein X975_16246, partial [Stegodyphus mimosarum]